MYLLWISIVFFVPIKGTEFTFTDVLQMTVNVCRFPLLQRLFPVILTLTDTVLFAVALRRRAT